MADNRGKPKKFYTKEQILDAMDKTKSIMAAARYLGCSYQHLKPYMKMYKDDETGKTLFEIHKNQCGKGVPKFFKQSGKEPRLEAILSGEMSAMEFNPQKLKYRLVQEGHLAEECNNCGFHERRVIDHKIPLILHFRDKNKNNWTRNNIEFLCYNCYFLFIDQVFNEKDIEQLESVQTKDKTSEQVKMDLDPYHLEQLKKLGLSDDNNDFDIVSYKD